MFGGHLPWNDEFTLSLITNDEVLAVDQNSRNNRQLFHREDLVAWTADVPDSADKYLALFNARDPDDGFDHSKALFSSGIVRGRSSEPVEITAAIKGARKLFLQVTTAGDSFENDHADWIEPRLGRPDRRIEVDGPQVGQGYRRLGRDARRQERLGPRTGPGRQIRGVRHRHPRPLGHRVRSAGRLRDLQGHGRAGPRQSGPGIGAVCGLFGEGGRAGEETATVAVSLADMGIAGPVRIRDLWTHTDLGVFEKTFARDLGFHGAGLYRLSPVPR